MSALVNFFKRMIATAGYIGYLPGMPGTWASIATVAILWWQMPRVTPWFDAAHAHLFWPAYALFVAFGILVCSKPRELFGAEDPKPVVIDEVAGQLITFFLIPLSPLTLVFGLLLFRFYDIVKPWPVHRFEEMGDGEGIMMDDVIAGILANLTLMLILFVYHLARARIAS